MKLFLAVLAVTIAAAAAKPDGHMDHGPGGKRMMHMKKMRKMHKHMRQMDWFVATDDTCAEVPSDDMIKKGDPMMHACTMAGAEPMGEVCVCKKPTEEMVEAMMSMGKEMSEPNPDTGFYHYCGKCMDPCALKWKMNQSHEEKMMEEEMMDEQMEFGPPSGLPRVVESLMGVAMQLVERSMMAQQDDMDAQ